MDMAYKLDSVIAVAVSHGHEFAQVRSALEARDEIQIARARLRRVRELKAASFVAAGFRERHLYTPMMNVGMMEGALFDLFDIGFEAGVRVVFVGTRERFDALPFRLHSRSDDSGVLCACELGF